MSRECQVCAHDHRATIEVALANRSSIKQLVKSFGISKESLYRHRRFHMSPQLIAEMLTRVPASPIDLEKLHKAESEGLLTHMIAQRGRLYRLIDQCEDSEDVGGGVRAHLALTRNMELIAKLVGTLNVRSQTITQNIFLHPDYHQVRTDLIRALRPFPEARAAVLAVLQGGERPVIEHKAGDG